jgi:hypothetical protein
LAEKARQRAPQEEQREREAFQRTPVGQAHTEFERGDHLCQYAHAATLRASRRSDDGDRL